MLTTKQVAELLKVDPSRVRQLILAGKLAATKHGRDWFIEPDALDAVRERKVGRPKKNA